MPINKRNLSIAVQLIGRDHAAAVVRFASKQDKMEQKWDLETKSLGREVASEVVDKLERGMPLNLDRKIFERFVLSHYFSVIAVAAGTAEEEINVISIEKRLAKPKTPRSLAEVRKIYDIWNKTGRMPKGLAAQASKIKSKYLEKVQKVWRRYSEDYRAGEESTKAEVVQKIKEAADVATSRARTIVRTETTNYYNDVRTEIYDQEDTVWGYLFLAIRDQGTTKWCTDRVTQGMRGRHGLVYQKNDPLTKTERPSCHWNCRSEFVPLSIYNPRHRKLIEDLSKRRENHKCHPLPQGWAA